MKKRTSLSYSCAFNPVRDFEAVVPELSVNVGEVMSTHVVPSSSDSTPYTKETEISDIGHYITDKLEGAIAMMKLHRSMSAVSRETKSTPSGAE